jgi:general bacterial porin, GBP family
MKTTSIAAGVAVLLACAHAHAQSSVSLYGLISGGLAYVSNEGGHSNIRAVSGQVQPSRWGLRGTEDLGGGTTAVFTLESGFSIMDGTLGQGGREFGRQAYVGLTNGKWGTLTMGRQYSPLGDALRFYESAVLWADTGAHIGDADNVFDTFRINNTVKYVSPTFSGFQLSALYGASNDAGNFADNRAYSVALRYNSGPLSLGAAYMQVDYPASLDNPNGAVVGDYVTIFRSSPLNASPVAKHRVAGAGGSYDIGKLSLSALATTARFYYTDGESLRIDSYEVNSSYRPTSFTLVGLAYIYSNGNYGGSDNAPHWHQINVGAQYLLSKRTDLSLVTLYQRAAGGAKFAALYSLPASNSVNQLEITVGLRHRF